MQASWYLLRTDRIKTWQVRLSFTSNTRGKILNGFPARYKRISRARQHRPTDTQLGTERSPTTSTAASTQDLSIQQTGEPLRYASPSITDLVFDKQSDPPSGRVVYMGDSSNMKYLVHEVGDPFKHVATGKLWGDNLQRSLTDRLSPVTLSKLEQLRSWNEQHMLIMEALKPLDSSLSEELLAVFFDQAHPFFQLVDETDLRRTYMQGQASRLLLNALYCVATIHCGDLLIQRLGFDSRYLATATFYQRTKFLFDTDYDTDGITNLQACVLLINWWGSPMEQKDTWYWLGVATHLAQALGMHRAYVKVRDIVSAQLISIPASHTRSCILNVENCGDGSGGFSL